MIRVRFPSRLPCSSPLESSVYIVALLRPRRRMASSTGTKTGGSADAPCGESGCVVVMTDPNVQSPGGGPDALRSLRFGAVVTGWGDLLGRITPMIPDAMAINAERP